MYVRCMIERSVSKRVRRQHPSRVGSASHAQAELFFSRCLRASAEQGAADTGEDGIQLEVVWLANLDVPTRR